jgi:DNA polymerase I-like protein with 3'-5' exonuclease and polymerase domains
MGQSQGQGSCTLIEGILLVDMIYLILMTIIKDVYAGERRKAKTLNFSIAYGKTVHGLAKDWNVTHEEAQNTLNRYSHSYSSTYLV